MAVEISEKEFAVIREIHNNHLPDQRTIATRTGISLGLTNLIIKKLINKGYIKAKQLNQKKIQYMLTPKGFSEKAKKSYSFTLKTINLLAGIRSEVEKLVSDQVSKGFDRFEVTGSGEVLNIAEMSFKKINGVKYDIKHAPAVEDNAHNAVMLAINSVTGESKYVNIVEYLADTGIMVW